MLKETYYSKGKNNFKDNIFSAQEWSAPLMVSPAEIKSLIESFRLEGRKIKRLKMIGLTYNLRREWIEDRAYNFYEDLDEDTRQEKSNYSNIEPSIPYCRYAEIDEPLLIEFEDGDVFEIDTPQQPEFSISMNCIPWWIDAGANMPNADADILFAPCLGRIIDAVEVKTYETDTDPMLHSPFDEDGTKKELVSAIILHFDNGTGLCIEGWIDFCHVTFIDEQGQEDTVTFEELKPALFNWEDLHIDPFSGYEANSGAFNFGKLGAEHTEEPYMTLVPGEKDTSLNIAVSDFALFRWGITHYKKECFDEYGEYEFNKTEWKEILSEAEKLVSFDKFDDLFEYVTSIKIEGYKIIGNDRYSVTLNEMNYEGAEFWNHINRYRTQLEDMKAWSELVLSDSDKISIFGF